MPTDPSTVDTFGSTSCPPVSDAFLTTEEASRHGRGLRRTVGQRSVPNPDWSGAGENYLAGMYRASCERAGSHSLSCEPTVKCLAWPANGYSWETRGDEPVVVAQGRQLKNGDPGDTICTFWDVTDHRGDLITVGFVARANMETSCRGQPAADRPRDELARRTGGTAGGPRSSGPAHPQRAGPARDPFARWSISTPGRC
jgi:hypothetical protein